MRDLTTSRNESDNRNYSRDRNYSNSTNNRRFSYFLIFSDELSYIRCMKLCDTSCYTLSDQFASLIRIINIWRDEYRMIYFDLGKLTENHYDSRIDKELYDSCQGYFCASTIQCYMVTNVSTDKSNQDTDQSREK